MSINQLPYIVLLTVAGAILYKQSMNRSIKQSLQRAQSHKQAVKQREIEHVLSLTFDYSDSHTNPGLDDVSALEREILGCTALQLRDRIQQSVQSSNITRHFTCYNVMLTYCRQAIRIDRLCNAITEPMFESALKRARMLDEEARNQSELSKAPLFGVPITLKDSVGVKGIDCTLGIVAYANQPMIDDSTLVNTLMQKGAQIFCKTNIPQTLLSFECKNPLFGITNHLENPKFTPGGSSGGESVLLAGGGSILGVGTDIGGSVRIPAHMSGHPALKPTSRRVSLLGFRPSVPGQETIPGIVGPMAQNVDDLILLTDCLIDESSWKEDCDIVPMSLDVSFIHRSIDQSVKLKIGYWVDDGFLHASPACTRGVEIAVQALRARGHTVELYRPPAVLECIRLYYALMSADGAKTITDQLKNDKYEDYTSALVSAVNLPKWIKSIVSSVLRLMKDERGATIVSASGKVDVNALWKLQAAKKAWKNKFWKSVNEHGYDVLLNPAHIMPATQHGQYKAISFTAAPTMIYNVLDCPAGVVPVTRVQAQLDQWSAPTQSISVLEKAVRKAYDPVAADQLPIGVQIAARPFREELVLRVMKELELEIGAISKSNKHIN